MPAPCFHRDKLRIYDEDSALDFTRGTTKLMQVGSAICV